MSWVIARYLCKSGGNNIRFRIGQFNKWSSPKAMCKKLSTALSKSCLVEKFQKNKNMRVYETINNYVSFKTLYKDGEGWSKMWWSKLALMDMWGKLYSQEIIANYTKSFKHWSGSLKKYDPIIRQKFIHKNNKYSSMDTILKCNGRYSLPKYIFIGIGNYNTHKHFDDWWWHTYG